jgi:tetratricopeptide (TPR) repeat protein
MNFHRLLARLALGLALACSFAVPAAAQSMREGVNQIRASWEHITYEVRGSSTQTRQLDQLENQAAALVARFPGQAEPLLWQGIVVSEQANRANFLHQLGLAREALRILTRAYQIDPDAANGGVAMSLAVLYYKVPGSPIGFGDDERAGRLLRRALQLDPDGLDANYFYADYLHEQGDDAGAARHLRHALAAPRSTARPVWDAGRRREINALLREVS